MNPPIGSYVIVYSGPFYGQAHKVVGQDGPILICRHEPSFRDVRALKCDAEPARKR